MAISNATRLADFGSGIGTQGATITIDNANKRLGVNTTSPGTTTALSTTTTTTTTTTATTT